MTERIRSLRAVGLLDDLLLPVHYHAGVSRVIVNINSVVERDDCVCAGVVGDLQCDTVVGVGARVLRRVES